MSPTTRIAQPLPTARQLGIDDALAAWRGIAREQYVGALLLALVSIAPYIYMLASRAIAMGQSLSSLGPVLLQLAVGALINAFTLLAAVLLADRAVDRGTGRLRAYALAVVFGVLAGNAIGWALNTYVISAILPVSGLPADKLRVNPKVFFTVGLSRWLEWLTLGALATYVYADRREVRRIAAMLRVAQDRRLAQVRQRIESELMAMQARVEPQFLFDTLGHIQQRYETDAVAAERMLDGLIAFLRAAMPELRSATSTLEQEIALASAYVAIESARCATTIRWTSRVPDDLRAASVPPMTIVPLFEQAMALEGANATAHAGEGEVELAAYVRDGRLQITMHLVDCRLPRKAAVPDFDVLRQRLVVLFGAGAEVGVSRIDARTAQAMLALPYRSVSRHPKSIDVAP